MLGSLYKIWPFQKVTAATAELPFKEQQFEHLWPHGGAWVITMVIALTATAFAATLLLEKLGEKFSSD
jgi:hypothetical protein